MLCWVSSSSHSLMMMPRISEACCVLVWYAACSPTHPLRCSIPVQSRLQQRQSGEDHPHANAADVGGVGRGKWKTPERHKCNLEAAREEWLSWVVMTFCWPLESVGMVLTWAREWEPSTLEKKIPKAVQGKHVTTSRLSSYHLGYNYLELVIVTRLLAWTSSI